MSKYIDAQEFIKRKREVYCKDCSRRKAYINGKTKFIYEIGSAVCGSCGVNDILDALEDYPAADVQEVKHGKWILTGTFDDFVKCSKCGGSKHAIFAGGNYLYCYECGAKMGGEKE